MSRNKNRFLFFHELNGIKRQLFYVIEKPDDSLIIVIKNEDDIGLPSRPRNIFCKDYIYRPLTTTRISIHNSDNSLGMLIKKTNELYGKTAETHACFISESKIRLFHPVLYKLYPDLSNQKYIVKKPLIIV